MADLYISEFPAGASGLGSTSAPIVAQPALAIQKIAIGAAAQSAAFNAKTNAVLLIADGACHVLFGANPTAAATDMLIPANVPLMFAVIPGQKLSVIT